MLKLYIIDYGVYGVDFCVAPDLLTARDILSEHRHSAEFKAEKVVEYDIEAGFSYSNIGDT